MGRKTQKIMNWTVSNIIAIMLIIIAACMIFFGIPYYGWVIFVGCLCIDSNNNDEREKE